MAKDRSSEYFDSPERNPVRESFAVRLLNRLFDHRNIVNCDRDIYLRRWFVIRKESFALFVHKFERSDEDRALHDHPWDFLVIPIWRGYYEHTSRNQFESQGVDPCPVSVRRRVLPILGTRFRRGTYRHRVELTQTLTKDDFVVELPSWSIFIRFNKWRDWGFWMPNGFVQWQQWWRQNCE